MDKNSEVAVRQNRGYTPNSTLMENARALLKGKWGLCVGVTLVYLLITSATNGANRFGGGLISLVLGGPLTLGLSIFFLNIVRKKDVEFTNLFDGFNRFGVAFLAYILVAIFVILWSLLLIIPGIIAALSYSMTYYIIVDNDTIDAQTAIKKSKAMMNGHKLKLFYLGLNFLGWALLCILTLGIGFLWLFPYMGTSFALFYEDIKGN